VDIRGKSKWSERGRQSERERGCNLCQLNNLVYTYNLITNSKMEWTMLVPKKL
jgi:hypothetical protein